MQNPYQFVTMSASTKSTYITPGKFMSFLRVQTANK